MKFIKLVPIALTLILSTHLSFAKKIAATDASITYSGRTVFTSSDTALLGYSGTRLRCKFEGETITINMRSTGNSNWVNVFIDGTRITKQSLTPDFLDYSFATNLTPGSHTLELVKATEGFEGNVEIAHLKTVENNNTFPWIETDTHTIEFIGDSITCGYGIEAESRDEHWSPSTENFCDTYAWHTAKALNADYLVVARSGIGMLRNFNGPRSGSEVNLPALYHQTFFHKAEPKWDFSRFTPEVVCINLGTNDFSTTGVDPEGYENAYLRFVTRLLKQYPDAKIVCLLGPMLNAPEVKNILLRVSEEANKALKHPRVFHFEMTAQGPLGYGADWHPSKAQGDLNAKELTAYLRGLMNW